MLSEIHKAVYHMKEAYPIIVLLFCISTVNAQLKKDGTPDMRYKANKLTYSTNRYTIPQNNQRNYNNGGQYRVQSGYLKKNGKYVGPHLKTSPDNYKWNNRRKRK